MENAKSPTVGSLRALRWTCQGYAAILTVMVLLILRLVSRRLPHKAVVDAEIVWRRDAAEAEAAVEAAVTDIDPRRRADLFELIDGGESVRRSFRL